MLAQCLLAVLLALSGTTLIAARRSYSRYAPYRKCDDEIVSAICRMEPDPDAPFNVTGVVTLTQRDHCGIITGPLVVRLRLKGFPKRFRRRLRGLNVHTNGHIFNGCANVGPHFNPFNNNHGAPTAFERHVGDLGNVPVRQNGRVDFTLRDRVASLVGRYTILGRSLAIHADTDDLGLGGDAESLRTGNSGPPVACCVIGRIPPPPIPPPPPPVTTPTPPTPQPTPPPPPPTTPPPPPPTTPPPPPPTTPPPPPPPPTTPPPPPPTTPPPPPPTTPPPPPPPPTTPSPPPPTTPPSPPPPTSPDTPPSPPPTIPTTPLPPTTTFPPGPFPPGGKPYPGHRRYVRLRPYRGHGPYRGKHLPYRVYRIRHPRK